MGGAESWIIIGGAFFVAGLVKGVVGVGLPSVAVGLLGVTIGIKAAMALLLVPSFVTNVWQAVTGNALAEILKRTWPMLLTICAGTWLGVALLARLDGKMLSMVLGATLIGYALMGFSKLRLPHPGRNELPISLPVGIVHGVVAGMTGSYIPAVPFLQSLGLSKDVLVQAMGVLFTVSTVALAVCMADQRLLSRELALASTGAVVPALVGMYAGQLVRGRLSEDVFRRVLFCALGALGAYILVRAVG